MKKIVCIIILAILYFQRFDYVDLSSFQSEKIRVEIKGEVNQCDVYELAYQSNVKDLIQKAKGLKEEADTASLNMNQQLQNGDVIVIAKKKQQEKISINSASKEELMELVNIGEAMANRIIEYRQNITFQKIEDIMNVKGIKGKLFNKIKDFISL